MSEGFDTINKNLEAVLDDIYEETDNEIMDERHPDVIDLTTKSTGGLQANMRNSLGTSKPEFLWPHSLLRINADEVVLTVDDDHLPSSNRAESIESSRSDLLSARSTQSLSGTNVSTDSNSDIHSNRFCIMVLPDEEPQFEEMCKRKIGNSSKMCIKANCTTQHRGDLGSVIRGDIFVQKNSDSVFLEPRVHDNCITMEVLNSWLYGPRRQIGE